MRALTCPKALESPKRSMIRLASATSRRSARSAARRPLALLTRELRLTTQGKQRFGGDRVVLARCGERVDRSPGRESALQALDRAGLSGDPAAREVGEVSGPHAVPLFASGRLWRKPRSKCPRPARSPCSKIQV